MILEMINKHIVEPYNKRFFDPFYKKFFSVTKDTWKYYAMFQPTSEKILRNSGHPIWGPLVRRLYRLEGENYATQGHILPLNKSLDKSDRISKSMVTP